jgi:SAM-dependent methyltransferase
MISVFTPFHKPIARYLTEAYTSLLNQSYQDWEWILVPNNGAVMPEIAVCDKVHVVPAPAGTTGIGYFKHFACANARGEILLELDADDILTPDCLARVATAFTDTKIGFVYSNSAEFEDATWKPHVYSAYWGWRQRPFSYDGHDLTEMIAWKPSPHMLRYVYWSPNHVRAWRTSVYREIGGHDESLAIGDDHDLCCRTYLAVGAGGMRHIDKCLYLYRVRPNSTCRLYTTDVQTQTEANYCKYSRDMATRWAKEKGLQLLDLGGRFNPWPEYETVDVHPPTDIISDLNRRWPFGDNSVGVLKAYHVFEHLQDPIHVMNEAYRVLAPGGWLFIEVPSTDGRGAFQDPTHISFWNENSFWYYTDARFARFIKPRMGCRFQRSRIVTYFPTDFERQHNIPIVQADLIALKPPYDERPPGEVLI